MKSVALSWCIAILGTCSAVLAGCAVSSTTTPGVLLQQIRHQETTAAFMDPSSSLGTLLYTSSGTGEVFVYSYPQGKRVGQLTGFDGGAGLCVDAAGDIFIPSTTNQSTQASTIYEYAHGGTEPIAALSDSGAAYGCSVDPSTGDLAVANGYDTSNPYAPGLGSLAIYSSAQGMPRVYYSSVLGVHLCGYNAKGILFLSIYNIQEGKPQLAQFTEESGSFSVVKLGVTIHNDRGGFNPVVQWDGKHMTISSFKGTGAPLVLYRLQISGKNAKVVGTTTLLITKNKHLGQSWIQGKQVVGIAALRGANNIAFWAYPEGGDPKRQIKKVIETSEGSLDGIVVSPTSGR